MKEINRNINGNYIVEIDKSEKNVLKSYSEMRKYYPDDNLLIISPESYFGFNLETGKAISLEFKELDGRYS